MKKRFYLVFMFLFTIFLVSNAFSAVEVFSQYNTKIEITKNYSMNVEKEIYLKNIHDVGIVPGQIEFKIEYPSEKQLGELLDYSVKDRYGNDIKSSIRKTANASYILLDIFTPILPGFEYKIDLKYTLRYKSSGFFFKTFQVPLKENTRIPIESGSMQITVPKNYHITYLGYENENTLVDGKTVTWQIGDDVPESVTLEYSYLPINVGGIRGSLIFWLAINLILIVVLVLEILKETKKLKDN